MKKLLTFILCAAMVFSIAACANHDKTPDTTESQQPSGNVQIANPYKSFDTLEAAAEAAGFSIQLPATVPNWVSEVSFGTINGKMLEIIYAGENDKITLRKAPGADDISGDYNVYSETNELTVGEKTVTVKGNDSTVSVAIWQDGEYTYAMTFQNGMDLDGVSAMLENVQ